MIERSANPSSKREQLKDWLRFVRGDAHILIERPQLLFQQAANQADTTAPALKSKQRAIAGLETRPWLRWSNKPHYRGPCVMTLAGHLGRVNACALSRNSLRIVSAGDDQTVRVWDALTGMELATLVGHQEPVAACAISPNGRLVVSAGERNPAFKLWELTSGAVIADLEGHSGAVTALAFSPDGQRIASGSADATLRLWDVQTQSEQATLTGKGIVYSCAFAEQGSRIVFSDMDCLNVWDTASVTKVAIMTMELEQRLWGSELASPVACSFSPDGTRIASAWNHGPIMISDLKTGSSELMIGHMRSANACAFAPDGKRVVSASSDKMLKIWDAATHEELASLSGHEAAVTGCFFSSDGAECVSSSGDGTLKIWSPAETENSPASLARDRGPVMSGAISPDATRVVVALWNNSLQVRDIATCADLATMAGHQNAVARCRFDPSGKRVLSASHDKTLKVWNADTGKQLALLTQHSEWVTDCAWSPDGAEAVSAAADNSLVLWKPGHGARLKLKWHDRIIRGSTFSPDGQSIIFGSSDQVVQWNPSTNDTTEFSGHEQGVEFYAFFPDGLHILSGSNDGTLRKWNAITHVEVWKVNAGTRTCNLSSDGSRIAGRTEDGIRIWDAGNGSVLATLATGDSRVRVAAFLETSVFSPDGRRIAFASVTTVRIWDAASGCELCDYRLAATEGITQFGFMGWAPDSRSVIVVCEDGSIHKLTLENLASGAPIVTAWRCTPRRTWWRRNVAIRYGIGCPLCRGWSEVPASSIGSEVSCPNCNELLRLNSFVIEGEWRSIAKAWGDTDRARRKRRVAPETDEEMRALQEKLMRRKSGAAQA